MPDSGLAIPELVVRDVVQAAMTQLATDQKLQDFLIGGLVPLERQTIVTMLQNRDGRVRLGYGLEALEDWQALVLLANAHPLRQTLSNVVGDLREAPSLAVAPTLGADVSATDAGPLVLVGTVPLTLPPLGRVRIDDELAIYRVDAGVVTLTARGVQETDAAAHASGAAVVFHGLEQLTGYMRRATVRVDVVSTNALFTMVVGNFLGIVLLAQAPAFELQGMTWQSQSDSDMAPRPGFWPPQFLSRTITIEFDDTIGVPQDLGLVTDVTVDVQPEVQDGIQAVPSF